MGDHITGSVGIVNPSAKWRIGKSIGNRASDQQTIIRLLAKIPASKGGKKEQWEGQLPPPGGDGLCLKELGDAIWDFQSHWKAAGVFKNIDGVVDPGGNTIRVMNTLLLAASVKPTGPNTPMPPNTTDLTEVIKKLRGLFPSPTRWTLTNAPGISAGFIASASIGQLDVKEDGAAGEKHLTYASGGMEMGWSPEGSSPVTFSASTRDMWSATSIKALSGMGRIFSRLGRNLTFDDMTGPLAILGITGAAPMKFYTDVADAMGGKMIQGLSFNVFMLGITPGGESALQRLTSVGNIGAGMMAAVKDCKAICMSAGEVLGVDLSIGVTIGAATGFFSKWDFLDQVQNNEAKAAYDAGKKTVTDTLNKAKDDAWNKIKDWSPF
jgi:hypothetical protein